MASSSRPTAAGGHGRGITHPRSHDPTGAPAPITGNNNNSSPPSESPSFQILTTPPQKPLREIRLNPDLANLRYRTFDQCKWEDVVFAFEELIGGVWKNIPTPAVDPNTGCFDFRNCRVKTIQLTKKSVELLEQASEDAIQLVGVWCEDVRWGWPEKDIAFVWDGDGVFSTDPPLSRGCSVDGREDGETRRSAGRARSMVEECSSRRSAAVVWKVEGTNRLGNKQGQVFLRARTRILRTR